MRKVGDAGQTVAGQEDSIRLVRRRHERIPGVVDQSGDGVDPLRGNGRR